MIPDGGAHSSAMSKARLILKGDQAGDEPVSGDGLTRGREQLGQSLHVAALGGPNGQAVAAGLLISRWRRARDVAHDPAVDRVPVLETSWERLRAAPASDGHEGLARHRCRP